MLLLGFYSSIQHARYYFVPLCAFPLTAQWPTNMWWRCDMQRGRRVYFTYYGVRRTFLRPYLNYSNYTARGSDGFQLNFLQRRMTLNKRVARASLEREKARPGPAQPGFRKPMGRPVIFPKSFLEEVLPIPPPAECPRDMSHCRLYPQKQKY